MAAPQHTLADFLEQLEQAGELARVTVEVDSALEIAAITERVTRTSGRALSFQQVRGHHPAVVTNLLGSEGRICRALGVRDVSQLAERVAALLSSGTPESWLDRLRGLGGATGLARFSPRAIKAGPCQQVVKLGRDVDLAQLPALRSWSLEPRPAITAGQVFWREPETGRRHVGAHLLEVVDRTTLAVVWHRHELLEQHFHAAQTRGERLPMAVALGGDPAWCCATIAPLPSDVDRSQFAGLLRGQALEIVKCRTQELEAPADADLIIEGYVDPQDSAVSIGPLAGPFGYYSSAPLLAQALRVTAITQRSNPIFPAIVWGRPPHEHSVLTTTMARVLLPLVKWAVPEVIDVGLPGRAGCEHLVVVSIRKTYPQQARKVAGALWGLGQFQFAKFVVLVDPDVDVHDISAVLLALGTNVHPGRDTFASDGPASPWDHATPRPLCGQRLGIDATSKLPEEHPHSWPATAQATAEVQELLDNRWAEYGLGL